MKPQDYTFIIRKKNALSTEFTKFANVKQKTKAL